MAGIRWKKNGFEYLATEVFEYFNTYYRCAVGKNDRFCFRFSFGFTTAVSVFQLGFCTVCCLMCMQSRTTV